MRVLIVEDETYLAEAIRGGLRLEGTAADIAVLDRDTPGPSGDEIAKRIIASGSGMPWSAVVLRRRTYVARRPR